MFSDGSVVVDFYVVFLLNNLTEFGGNITKIIEFIMNQVKNSLLAYCQTDGASQRFLGEPYDCNGLSIEIIGKSFYSLIL